ncbi:exocyst complex protein exo70 [Didymella exigua CBS 183.55]|uniref:Exocyst complex protein EXO70 n=1 Tax=Didymella exigua CBS 183.55 TaxID=1150837 RepID=A0A6A5RFH4_9PLEO|nr:exocyst complex protein exo70 [Didymella exigua CBS 183.55]KAF1927035.1 exocyst complex protein exo70 [Didymella exigua CBS 183.55]
MVGPRKPPALAEESAEVEVLYANMDKMKTLTKKIQASVNRLDASGKAVQDAISPIYGNTQKLQIATSNIDRVIEAIERLRAPRDQSEREERIIRAGPGRGDLRDYIASLDRTTMALADLKRTNLRSNEQAIAQLNGLLKLGNKQLEDVFRSILEDCSRTKLQALEFVAKNEPFPHLPGEKLSTLRGINNHISQAVASTSQADLSTTPTQRKYADIRGSYLESSLGSLAQASVATARKVQPDALYKKGQNGIGTYVQAIEGIFVAEYDNISNVFARPEWMPVCEATCQPSLAEFSRTLRELNGHIQKNLLTDCFLGYEICGMVRTLSIRLQESTGTLKGQIYDSVKPIRETSKTSLSKLIEDTRVRTQTLVALPMDGAAVPITTETMRRLQEMPNYLDPLSSILASLGEGGWNNPSANTSSTTLDVSPDVVKLFASYASDTIDTLIQNLMSKAKILLKGKTLQGIFLANNIAIVTRVVRNSELAPLMESYAGKLQAWRKTSSAMYLEAWREPSGHLLDVQYTNRSKDRPHSGGGAADSAAIVKGLGSKDKDAIKEKFKNFNTIFEDLVARHKTYAMEAEVRSALSKEVQNIIEPLYNRFYDKYREIDKGKGKYVKYDKVELNKALTSFA